MPLNSEDIEALIPHSGAMSLLSQVVNWDKDGITCMANSHRSLDNPLKNEGSLSSACGIEYAAQAMAVHGALSGTERNKEPRPGFIALVKNLRLGVARLDDIESDMTIKANLLISDQDSFIYEFIILAESRELVSGRVTIFIRGN
jgi:predicted hotdog family 3-hydroxylacyl-ACP dehydratase